MQNSDRLQSTVYVDNTKYYGSSNKLIVLSNGQITEYDLAGMKKDRLFFGSSMQCDIVINDPVISEIQGKISAQAAGRKAEYPGLYGVQRCHPAGNGGSMVIAEG